MVIASRTGWTESYIRWHLPLRRGMAYFHAAMLLDGIPMRWPSDRAEAEQEFDKSISRIRNREAQRKKKISAEKKLTLLTRGKLQAIDHP